MTRPTLAGRAVDLIHHLGRGGKYQHWWRDKRSWWFETDNPAPLPGSLNIYFSVSPVNAIPSRTHPETGQPKAPEYTRAGNREIVALNCLYAEWDAKDYGDKAAIMALLDGLRIPPAVLVDSGNGYHGYWLFPRPVQVTDANRDALRRLQARWNAYVGGDPEAKDLARVLRVPGTLNGKYDPKRPVKFEWYDEDYIPLYGLERHLNKFAPAPPPPAVKPVKVLGNTREAAYGRAALENQLSELACAPAGQRNGQLNDSAFALGRLVGGGILDAHTVRTALTQTALGMGTDSSFTPSDIAATIQSGLDAGLKEPRGLPHDRR